MTVQDTNTTGNEAIDSQRTIADVELGAEPGTNPAEVDVRIEGTDSADYVVEVADADETTWFEEASVTGASSVSEKFETPHARLRVRVTTAASTGGATADVLVGARPS
jgi:hypothetical protein